MAKTKSDAPTRRTCGAMAAHMMLLEKYPSFRSAQMRLEGVTARRRDSGADLQKATVATIKTIVHVVYKTPEQNISDAQIKSQFAALNRDFRATNPDKSHTPVPFKGLVTDARMQFKLERRVTRRVLKQLGESEQIDRKTAVNWSLNRSYRRAREPGL